MYRMSLFYNIKDNDASKRIECTSWEVFVKFLEKLSKRELESKASASLISPAIFIKGTTRANKNVECWGNWAAVDVDDFPYDYTTFREKLEELLHGWKYVCYSTASSSLDKPKFRLVFDLDREVVAAEIKRFWFALNSELGSIGDKQTKDASRMFYIPANYMDSYNFFFSSANGKEINVSELIKKYPYVERGKDFLDNLPEELRKQVIEFRKSKLDNSSVKWTSYRDCPFFPKKLAVEYKSISDTGWYHTMFRIMVSIACNALNNKYPITVEEIAELCRQFDADTGNWYKNRPLKVEANSALEYAYKNVNI